MLLIQTNHVGHHYAKYRGALLYFGRITLYIFSFFYFSNTILCPCPLAFTNSKSHNLLKFKTFQRKSHMNSNVTTCQFHFHLFPYGIQNNELLDFIMKFNVIYNPLLSNWIPVYSIEKNNYEFRIENCNKYCTCIVRNFKMLLMILQTKSNNSLFCIPYGNNQ
jgi:hypothetical protein